MKIWHLLTALLLLAAFTISPAWSWGPSAHTMITEKAIGLLPAELKPFYETNSRYIVAMCTLPDDWRDTHKADIGPQHYIDLDLLSKPPFSDLILDREAAEKRFGEKEMEKAGLLPWAIVERFDKLVKAMKEGDSVGIVVQSAVLAHFIGDAHVPFHTTVFYDGRTTDQKGIHFHWEEALVALMLQRESVRPREPEQVTDPLKSAFGWCIDSYGYLDPIYAADDKARKLDPGHAFRYYKSLYSDTRTILEGRLASASEATAGIYMAAWKAAGKPTPPDGHAPLFWGR